MSTQKKNCIISVVKIGPFRTWDVRGGDIEYIKCVVFVCLSQREMKEGERKS